MAPKTQKAPDRGNGRGPEFPHRDHAIREAEFSTDRVSDAIDAAFRRHRQFQEDVARARRWCIGRGLSLYRHPSHELFQVADASSGFVLEGYGTIDEVLTAIAARDGGR